MVANPGRDVNSMINVADMFQLFGEVAGIDVHKSVPRPIDSHPMMAYLTNPTQTSLRDDNFTQGGFNIQVNRTHNGPCVVPFPRGRPLLYRSRKAGEFAAGAGQQIRVRGQLRRDWWGPDADPASTLAEFDRGRRSAASLNRAISRTIRPTYAATQVIQIPQLYWRYATKNTKLGKNEALQLRLCE